MRLLNAGSAAAVFVIGSRMMGKLKKRMIFFGFKKKKCDSRNIRREDKFCLKTYMLVRLYLLLYFLTHFSLFLACASSTIAWDKNMKMVGIMSLFL